MALRKDRLPLQVSDYTVLPLRTIPPPSYPNSAVHYLYLRPHQPKIPHKDSPRSLFLVNVPFDSTLLLFRSLFATQLGGARLERLEFEEVSSVAKHTSSLSTAHRTGLNSRKRKRTAAEDLDPVPLLPTTWDLELHRTGSNAVAVFADQPSMQLAFKAAKKAARAADEITWGKDMEDHSPSLGSQRYLTHHNLRFPSTHELQSTVDLYMTTFAAAEASRSRSLARQRQMPDADGFIPVTRGGRTGPARLQETQDKMEELKKKEEAKRAGMGNFYRFQAREARKLEAAALVTRFAEDRQKVEEMRRQRGNRFRPV